MKNHKLVGISLAGAVVAAIGAIAGASTTTNTPASACVPLFGTYAINDAGHGQNTSTAGLTSVVCPIDRAIAPTVATKVAATVWVVDRSSTDNVCCTLESANENGVQVKNPTPICSTGASTAAQALQLPQIVDGFTFSHFQINCVLPAAASASAPSKLVTYRSIVD